MQFLPTVCVSLYNEQLCDLFLVASSGKLRHFYQAPWVVLIFVGRCRQERLASSFKKCNRKRKDFGECLVQAVEDAVGQLTKPFKEVGLNSLDPLEVPSMTIAPGSGPTNFQQNYKNMKITGFSKPKISKFEWVTTVKNFVRDDVSTVLISTRRWLLCNALSPKSWWRLITISMEKFCCCRFMGKDLAPSQLVSRSTVALALSKSEVWFR